MAVTRQVKDEMESSFRTWFDSLRDAPESLAVQRALEIVLVAEQQRQTQGLTYTQLAKRMGVSKAYISKLFQGNENSTLVSLCKLAQALGCTLEVRLSPPSGEAPALTDVDGADKSDADVPVQGAGPRPARKRRVS